MHVNNKLSDIFMVILSDTETLYKVLTNHKFQ